MRPAETILNEKLEQGRTLENIRALAVALGRDDLRQLVERKIEEKRKAA